MTRLFVQYLVIYNTKNLPIGIKFDKVGSKLSQIQNKPSTNDKKLDFLTKWRNFAISGHTAIVSCVRESESERAEKEFKF